MSKEFDDFMDNVDKLTNDECCTPKGQIKRYVDCIGCDKKPSKNVELLKHPSVISENGNELLFDEEGNLIKELPKQDVDKLGNEDVPKLGYDERKQNLIDIMNDDAKDGLYDVREVEVHSLEILRNKIKNDISELTIFSSSYSGGYKQALIMVEGMIMDMLAQLPKAKETLYTLPQQEISDEEIEKAAWEYVYNHKINGHNIVHWINAIKWYREQLKSK